MKTLLRRMTDTSYMLVAMELKKESEQWGITTTKKSQKRSHVRPSEAIKVDVVLQPAALAHIIPQLLRIGLEEHRAHVRSPLNPVEKGVKVL
jgi:hypothetical protein